MTFWRKHILNLGVAIATVSTSIFTSCLSNDDIYINYDDYIDMYQIVKDNYPDSDQVEFNKLISNQSNKIFLKPYQNWINSLTNSPWDLDENGTVKNLYCYSERQALALYSSCWGHFWNIPLHLNQEPKDQMLNKKFINIPNIDNKNELEVRGNDWKKLQGALERAISPWNLIVYHGVEFMENAFWNQLEQFITYDETNKNYDYSNVVGKQIHSYGFLSTTTNKDIAKKFSQGYDWVEENIKLPLKEKGMFKIKIKQGTSGVAYISGFNIVNGVVESESQFLIKADTKFNITNISKEADINVFEMEMI